MKPMGSELSSMTYTFGLARFLTTRGTSERSEGAAMPEDESRAAKRPMAANRKRMIRTPNKTVLVWCPEIREDGSDASTGRPRCPGAAELWSGGKPAFCPSTQPIGLILSIHFRGPTLERRHVFHHHGLGIGRRAIGRVDLNRGAKRNFVVLPADRAFVLEIELG